MTTKLKKRWRHVGRKGFQENCQNKCKGIRAFLSFFPYLLTLQLCLLTLVKDSGRAPMAPNIGRNIQLQGLSQR